jgi:hypothetical protein
MATPIIFVPTRSYIASLSVGDLALSPYGTMLEVTEICYRGEDTKGRPFVGYTVKTGPHSDISMSQKANELTRHAALRQTSHALDVLEERILTERGRAS